MIVNALAGKPLPVYGDGQNVRDWLYVGDHCTAIRAVLAGGRLGETYNVGGNAEMKNLDVVRTLCRILAERAAAGRDYAALVTFVKDRPGHDRRYAIDARKIAQRARLGAGGDLRVRNAPHRAVVPGPSRGRWCVGVPALGRDAERLRPEMKRPLVRLAAPEGAAILGGPSGLT